MHSFEFDVDSLGDIEITAPAVFNLEDLHDVGDATDFYQACVRASTC